MIWTIKSSNKLGQVRRQMPPSSVLRFSALTRQVYKAWHRQGFFFLCSCTSFNIMLCALPLWGSSLVFLCEKQSISCLKLPRSPQYLSIRNGSRQQRWGNSHFSLRCSQWYLWGQALASPLHYFCWNTFWIKALHKLQETCPLPHTSSPASVRLREGDVMCPLHLPSDSPSCDKGETLQGKFKFKF